MILAVVIIATSSLAHGVQPMNVLKGHIDQVMGILKDPQYEEISQKALQEEKIWAIFQEIFDFTEVSRRAVGINWRGFTDQQRKEFTDVFAQFLGSIYLDRIRKNITNQQVVYLGENLISESKAMVKTKIFDEATGIQTPVGYNMGVRDGSWKVYDVKIEGVSLVKNYRSQFRKILLKESPDYLIAQLKKKIDER
jgi:phospholipid transport system substrate-binding protein